MRMTRQERRVELQAAYNKSVERFNAACDRIERPGATHDEIVSAMRAKTVAHQNMMDVAEMFRDA